MARIGLLLVNPPTPATEVLWGTLRDLGYVEGRDFVRVPRWSDNRAEELDGLARELVNLEDDIIVPGGNRPALAARRAISTIPIVVLSGNELVEIGLVASLARPALPT